MMVLIEILLFVVLLFTAQATSHIITPSFVIYGYHHYNNIIISSLHVKIPRQWRSIMSSYSTNNNDAIVDDTAPSSSSSVWRPYPHATPADIALAKSLNLWPLDAANVNLLNEVRHRQRIQHQHSTTTTTTAIMTMCMTW